VTDLEELQAMVEQLRSLRDQCRPMNTANPRYHHYSMAVSALLWVVSNLQSEAARTITVSSPVGLSGPKLNEVAYFDVARQAVIEGLNAVLVDAGRVYRIKIGQLLVGVVARSKDRPWEPDEASRKGVQAMIGVDYSQGDPAFYVTMLQAGTTPRFRPEARDRWDLLR
jgi:hypothetical protein